MKQLFIKLRQIPFGMECLKKPGELYKRNEIASEDLASVFTICSATVLQRIRSPKAILSLPPPSPFLTERQKTEFLLSNVKEGQVPNGGQKHFFVVQACEPALKLLYGSDNAALSSPAN